MKFQITIALAGIAMCSTAYAASPAPYYARVSGDVAYQKDTNVHGSSTGNINYGFNSGGNLALGYKPSSLKSSFGGVRAEIEGGYHAFGLDSVTANGLTNTNPKGDLGLSTAMVNLYYDVHTNTAFTPYIGAGAGIGHISLDKSNGFAAQKDSDNVFAYQFMTGVAYTPSSMPNTDFSLGYRFLGTDGANLPSATGKVSLDSLQSHNAEAGITYHF